jgi:hypothetical protein
VYHWLQDYENICTCLKDDGRVTATRSRAVHSPVLESSDKLRYTSLPCILTLTAAVFFLLKKKEDIRHTRKRRELQHVSNRVNVGVYLPS